MRKKTIILFLALGLAIAPTMESKAIVWKVVTAAIKKVVKAIDLQIQRQQNRVIWLQNAQKTVENTLSRLKLREIGDWADRQKKLYAGYFDELHRVRTLISYYQRIRDIIKKQEQIIVSYRQAWQLVQRDGHFTAEEIIHMGRVYEGILRETMANIEQLGLVIESFRTTMSDAERLEIIAEVDTRVDENLNDLRRFNTENALLSLKRARSADEIEKVRKLYGIQLEAAP